MAGLLLAALPLPAWSDELLSGVVRDADGYAVAGASVRLEAGGATARTTTGSDGAFALDRLPGATDVVVSCRYCRDRRVPVVGDEPLIVIVDRSAVLRDPGLGVDDLRALPYSRAADAAALLPFTVASTTAISDRGLAQGRGTVVVDGLPGYRALDGGSILTALPARAAARIDALDPTVANADGERASGGLFDIETVGADADALRIDDGDARDLGFRVGSTMRVGAALSDGDTPRERVALDAPIALGSDTLEVTASTADAPLLGVAWSGGTLSFTHLLRAGTVRASIADVASVDAAGPENDRVIATSYAAGGFTGGLRLRTSTGDGATGGSEYDDRVYVDLVRSAGDLDVHASLAYARDGETAHQTAHEIALQNGVVTPIVDVALHLTSRWSVRSALVDAIVDPPLTLAAAVPSFAFERTQLTDADVSYDNGADLRVSATTFRENVSGSSPAVLGGSGLDVTWQIAPAVALRAWQLISRQRETTAMYDEPVTSTTVINDRNVYWLTIGRSTRFDVIAHGGALDGDVVIPLGQVDLIAGTMRSRPSSRTVSIGLGFR